MPLTPFLFTLTAVSASLALAVSAADETKEYSLTIAKQEIEVAGGASYTINRNLAATALWDSNYGVGARLTIRF